MTQETLKYGGAGAICRAGLSRGRIRDALYSIERYRGVTGEMTFDPNAKNMAPMYLGTVRNGKFSYRRYTMEIASAFENRRSDRR
jgi:hypothetical protein